LARGRAGAAVAGSEAAVIWKAIISTWLASASWTNTCAALFMACVHAHDARLGRTWHEMKIAFSLHSMLVLNDSCKTDKHIISTWLASASWTDTCAALFMACVHAHVAGLGRTWHKMKIAFSLQSMLVLNVDCKLHKRIISTWLASASLKQERAWCKASAQEEACS